MEDRWARGERWAQPWKVLMPPSIQGDLDLPQSPCLRLVQGSWGALTPLSTLLTYFWALISKGLSCMPTSPSGPIAACLINQACFSPTPPCSCHTLPCCLPYPESHPAGEAEEGPEVSLGPAQSSQLCGTDVLLTWFSVSKIGRASCRERVSSPV